MRVAGSLLGVLRPVGLQLRFSLPFNVDAVDVSSNAITTRTAQGTPTYSGGALLLDSTDIIATGTANGQIQTPLDAQGNDWQLEFDVQMIATANTRILVHSTYTSDAVPNIQLEQSTGILRFRSYLNQDVITVNTGLDMSADFFNVKITQQAQGFCKLYINNVLTATSGFGGEILGNFSAYAGFVFGSGSNGAGFKIKNFKFYTT